MIHMYIMLYGIVKYCTNFSFGKFKNLQLFKVTFEKFIKQFYMFGW